MGKKLLIFSVLIFLPWGIISAQASGDQVKSLSAVLDEIMSAQGTSQVSQIDCTKISDEQFEQLGDAYMEQIHPGPAHVAMDTMMGGEGSTSLKSAHIIMGQNYLGCGKGVYANGLMPGLGIMGTGMMGGGFGWGMMGGQYLGGSRGMMGGFSGTYLGSWITMILFWILLLLAIAALIKWLSKNK